MFPFAHAILALAPIASAVSSRPATLSAPQPSDPCYIAFTAVVTDSITARIQRVITSGVRRLESARATGPTCVPDDPERLEAIKRAVRNHLARSSETRPIEFIEIRNAKPDIVSDHLTRIARFAAVDTNLSAAASLPRSPADSNAGLAGLEVIRLNHGTGRESDLVPLPQLPLNDSTRARCLVRNAALGRDSAVFHWAC